jgi:hypothetical protein
LDGSFPLVIFAVEAHTVMASTVHKHRCLRENQGMNKTSAMIGAFMAIFVIIVSRMRGRFR